MIGKLAYFDLKLTESGDLQTEMRTDISSFKLSFVVSEFSSQRVSFTTEPMTFPKKKKNCQRIIFNYVNTDNDFKLQNASVEDTEEQIQALRIALRTELGETTNYDIGTTAYKLQHYIISGDSDLETLATTIQDFVDEYVSNVTATISYVDNEKAGNFRYQAVTVTLTDNFSGKKLTEFIF